MASTITAGNATNGLALSCDNTGILELKTGTGSGTTAVTVSTGQRVTFLNTLSVGNATPSTSGAGITFPATKSPSSDANTLDDYEEGTFTPTLSGGFSVAPTSYTFQAGRYTKIGRLVFIEIDIDPNGATANATNIIIGALPFASSGQPSGTITVGFQASFNTNAGDTFAVDNGSTNIICYTNVGGGRVGNAANVNINNRIILSGSYVVS